MYWYYKGLMGLLTLHGVIIVYNICLPDESAIRQQVPDNALPIPQQIPRYSGTKEVLGNASHTHVIIVSGFRSGSSAFGDILNRDESVFFAYEPLHEQDYILIDDMTKEQFDEYASQMTSQILECNFPDMDQHQYNHLVARRFLGNRKLRCENGDCFEPHEMGRQCSRFPVHIIKFVRVTIEQVVHLLNRYSNVKIIWMYRDPRAVWNRRIRYDWCFDVLCANSDRMCQSMNSNYALSQSLLQSNPEQFTTVKFEDITRSPYQEFLRVLNFIGMDPTQVLEYVSKQKFTAESSGWETQLPNEEREKIEKKCALSLHGLAY